MLMRISESELQSTITRLSMELEETIYKNVQLQTALNKEVANSKRVEDNCEIRTG